MARIIPDGWQATPDAQSTPVQVRARDTLALLERELPADFTVFHGLHWSRVEAGHSIFGDVDFAVMGPGGALALVEQRTGFVSETAEGLVKMQAGRKQVFAHRLGRSVATLRAKLEKALAGGVPMVEPLLFLPDYQVRQPETAGLDASRIVDAKRRADLVPILKDLLAGPEDAKARSVVEQVLADELELQPDVGAVADAARSLYLRLSGGLADWARRIEMTPHRLRVIGTAGSGKTQLALAVYREALAAGRRPLFVCLNRPLADHFSGLVPAGGEVSSYLQLCNRVLRSTGLNPDFRQADAFSRIEEAFASMAVPAEWMFDDLIVDEGQDFTAAWRDSVLRLLKPEGRGWWLEDPWQNLYGKESVALPGWVALRSETNHRSPREIVAVINRLLADGAIEAGSPILGSPVVIETFNDRESLVERTRRAVTTAIGQGFSRDQIVLLSYHGRERSVFSGLDRLGPIPLRHFTGEYDGHGSPRFSDGDVLCETVYRFKGQSAPCVIMSEIDFETLDETARRKLFVGATRATLHLILVMSERARTALESGAKP
jgi:hypothetical protein